MRHASALLLIFVGCVDAIPLSHRPVREFEINLDLPVDQRFTEIVPVFNSSVRNFYNKYFANDKALADALYLISDRRGEEPEELMEEVKAYSDASRLPFKFVKAIQMLYEIQTLMVPVENFTKFHSKLIPAHIHEALQRMPWRGPGCTGIIANNTEDGTVTHARNLDFSPVPVFSSLVFSGIYTRGGKEIFRAQMIAGYANIVTGMVKGKNGFAIETNTRYTDHPKGNDEMLKNLFSGRPLNGWSVRQILQEETEYEMAVDRLSKVPLVATNFLIVSGVKKGTILARDPDSLSHQVVLGQDNVGCREDYILVTNFDYWFHDRRELFDTTGNWPNGKLGQTPRRVAATKLLDGAPAITPDVLNSTINAENVIADTIFQAIINVEKGIWDVSQPVLV